MNRKINSSRFLGLEIDFKLTDLVEKINHVDREIAQSKLTSCHGTGIFVYFFNQKLYIGREVLGYDAAHFTGSSLEKREIESCDAYTETTSWDFSSAPEQFILKLTKNLKDLKQKYFKFQILQNGHEMIQIDYFTDVK